MAEKYNNVSFTSPVQYLLCAGFDTFFIFIKKPTQPGDSFLEF